MSNVIIVTSLKGGVGKTTVAANLAMTLASGGHSVVAIDCDLESRCLDMILGLENDTLFNIEDVLSKRCTLDEALTTDSRCDNLSFIAAPATITDKDSEEFRSTFSTEKISALIAELREDYEYIIFDLPAHPDIWYELLLEHSDYALVVAMHTAVSVRSAEKTACIIVDTLDTIAEKNKAKGAKSVEDRELKIRLIINGFKYRDVPDGRRSGIYDIINRTSVALIGVVPHDEEMAAGQETGRLAYQIKGASAASTAFSNIAERIKGKSVPLLSGILKKRVRRKTF